jgi:hypothetical protein
MADTTNTKGGGTKDGGIRGWWSRVRQGQGSPVRLNFTDPPVPSWRPTTEAQPASPVKAPPSVIPDPQKPYIRFQNPNGAPLFLAHPVKFMPGRYQQKVIQPGSHDPLGNLGIWANDTAAEGFADWIDDPDAGLFTRKLYVVEDALGAKVCWFSVKWRAGVPC